MPYPTATDDDIAFFHEHGWIAVHDAIDPADLVTLEERCQRILDRKESMAFDWAWEKGQEKDERQFKILQSSPTMFWPELNDEPFRAWAVEFGSALMGLELEFWYDQFLAKPPGGVSVPTRWHQDEGYWGRLLDDRGITCWMPFHDVDRVERVHALHRRRPPRRRARARRTPPRCRATCSSARPTSRGRSRARSSSAASRSTTARRRT